jgi:hypothetical protein
VDLEEPHVPEKIMFLYDWAEKKTMGGDLQDVLQRLTSLKKDIGTTLRGKSLLTDMYKFSRLDAEKMMAKEKEELAGKTEKELEQLEEKMIKKEEKRKNDWAKTKDEIYQEADNKDLENIYRANTLARLIKSEDKQQSKTSINYKIAKDESPKAVGVKPYDNDPA